MALSVCGPTETSYPRAGPFTVGNNKNKVKNKNKTKTKIDKRKEDRPRRKDLLLQLESRQAENEALRARLKRVAELASAPEPAAGKESATVTL